MKHLNKTFGMSQSRHESGQAMITALLVVAATVTFVGIAIRRTGGSGRMAGRSADFTETERVADGVIEYAYGRWRALTLNKGSSLSATEIATLNQSLTSIIPSGYTMLPSTDPQGDGTLKITLVDYLGTDPKGAAVPRMITFLDDHPGWKGFTTNYVASVRLRADRGFGSAANRPIAGTRRMFKFTEVPLFQSMYFYEPDLEIYRPAVMIVGGLVHTNSRLMTTGSADSTGAELTYQGQVSYSGGNSTTPGYTFTEPPIGGPAWAGFTTSTAPSKMEAPTFANGGISAQLSKVDRYEPLGNKASSLFNTTDTNPNNDSFHELIDPPSTAIDPATGQVYSDPSEISTRRLYNKAGIVVTVDSTTITSTNRASAVTVTAKNGTTLTTAQTDAIKAALTKNSFYDERESKMVNVVNVDMSQLTTTLNAAAGTGFNGVFYIHDITSAQAANTRAIRLQKGTVLPDNGLTLASQNPVYIQGDYNVGPETSPTSVPANSTGNPNNTDSPTVAGYTRKPTAVLADSVVLLSNSWSDANAASSSTTLSNRIASNTTYNTAIMAGYIPSGWDPDGSGGAAAYGYSGGANNFPRFLENWSNKSCTYYGSMVAIYQSKFFTGAWNTGDIYSPPKRLWNFDPLFSTTPPPGSVDAIVINRGGWARL